MYQTRPVAPMCWRIAIECQATKSQGQTWPNLLHRMIDAHLSGEHLVLMLPSMTDTSLMKSECFCTLVCSAFSQSEGWPPSKIRLLQLPECSARPATLATAVIGYSSNATRPESMYLSRQSIARGPEHRTPPEHRMLFCELASIFKEQGSKEVQSSCSPSQLTICTEAYFFYHFWLYAPLDPLR